MAGFFTVGRRFVEWNVEQDIPAARYVARHWPTPILFCPFEAGEGILTGAAKEILGTYQVEWLGHQIDLTPSWKRITMADAVKNVTGADFMAVEGDADAAARLDRHVALMFQHFVDRESGLWVNQIDSGRQPITDRVPVRVLYHLVLALAEICRVREGGAAA